MSDIERWTHEEMKSKMGMIHHIDCLEFMRKVPDGYFDLVLTDPPYGTTKNKWDVVINLDLWWGEINRITKNNAAVVCFSAQPFTTDLIVSNRKNFRYSLVWDKVLATGFLNAAKMPMKVHEDICVFYKLLPYYNPIKTKGHTRKTVKSKNKRANNNYGAFENTRDYDTDERLQNSILTFSTGGTRTKIQHPTQKPIQLVEYLLQMYAQENAKVFDAFMGSGTTAVACKSLGLEWCGCELEADYVEIANKRLEKVQASLF